MLLRTSDTRIYLLSATCDRSESGRNNPNVKLHCWFSLECTNFSNAKGGQARDADSRTLAEHVDRYVLTLNPDVVWIENVKEFELWGPMIPKVITLHTHKKKRKTVYVPQDADDIEYYTSLINNGTVIACPLVIKKKKKVKQPPEPWAIPCPYRKGQDYKTWRKYICSLGYTAESRLLNCADYGIPQHRIRLIIQFNRTTDAANWPAQTNDKKERNGLPKWLPVGPCLNLDDEGESVLSFKMEKGKLVPRIESPKTIERLINGSNRHVIGKRESNWIVNYNAAKYEKDGSLKQSSGLSVSDASNAVTCRQGFALAKAHMIDHYFGNGYTKPVDEPAGVSGTKDGISLHTLQFLSTYHSTGDGSTLENSSPAIMTKDKYPLVSAQFVDMRYSSGQQNKAITEPSGAILNNPKQQVITVDRFIMDTQFNNGAHSLDEAARTQTASRKHFYLVNFQWFNSSFRGIDNPANTIIGSMHKAPNYLITLETGELAIEVFDYDPPHYVELKKYMAENGIVAINMRMRYDVVLLRIMSMNENTKLSKSSTANKKMIGNAVPPKLVEQLGTSWSKREYNEQAA